MAANSTSVERVLARLAGDAHGVVTRTELLAAKVSRHQIQRCLDNGSLIPEYAGVYRVGHTAPSREATYVAAVRACGKGALLSGRAAAHVHRLVKGKAPPPQVTGPAKHRIDGLDTSCRRLDPADRAVVLGIPVTTVARTLVDLAAELEEPQLARACHEAGVLHGTTPRDVERVLARTPRAPGAAKLRAVLTGEAKVALSQLESSFLDLLDRHGLPLPITNRPAGGRRVDCRWPQHRLTVELDGYRYHRSRHAWELDRRREREAYARGDEFRRYTADDVLVRPRLMLRELQGLIGRQQDTSTDTPPVSVWRTTQ